MLFNDTSIPLVAEGGRLDLAVDYSDAQPQRMYIGDFTWKGARIALKRDLPFSSDVMARFYSRAGFAHRNSVASQHAELDIRHSTFHVQLYESNVELSLSRSPRPARRACNTSTAQNPHRSG